MTPADAGSVQILFDRLAAWVVGRRLTVPAILLLEMHRPLSFVGSQVLLMMAPFLSLALPEGDIRALARELESRDGIERLILAIENAESSKNTQPSKETAP